MNKKIVIFIIVLILFFIAGGVFWWWQGREIKGSPEDYIIKETPEGKIVENKRAGLKVKAPEWWEEQKIEMEEGAVNFYSPETEIEWKEGKIVLPIKQGCMIQSTVVYKKMNFEQIEKEARYTHYMLGRISEEFEKITVNNYQALKNIFDTQQTGPALGIYVPKRDKGYAFYLYWGSDDKEKCIQEFNKFLETISIK